jgi:hypothetical protein
MADGPEHYHQSRQDPKPSYGCYLSVWRKQPDGRWRVLIDIGADSPVTVPFAPGFTRMAFGTRYTGKEGKEAAGKSLAEADRDLNLQIGAKGASRAYGERLTPASRLHRWGTVPSIGRDAIASWIEANATKMTADHTAAEPCRRRRLWLQLRQIRGRRTEAASGHLRSALVPRPGGPMVDRRTSRRPSNLLSPERRIGSTRGAARGQPVRGSRERKQDDHGAREDAHVVGGRRTEIGQPPCNANRART